MNPMSERVTTWETSIEQKCPTRVDMMMKRLLIACCLTVALALTSLIGCVSRYRLHFYLVDGEVQSKIKIEKTQYIVDGVLNTPMEREKIVTGPGNCIVLITGSRGATVITDASVLVEYDQYLRYKIFLQLPSRPRPITIELKNNSFVQLLGQYERPPEDKIFIAQGGTLVVDSIPDEHLFGTLDGDYENHLGEPVSFRGRFKLRVIR